jgi:Ca-activated chloride channel family protein
LAGAAIEGTDIINRFMRFTSHFLIAGAGVLVALGALSAAQVGGRGGFDNQRQLPGAAPASATSTVSVQPPPFTDLDTVPLYVSVTGKDNAAVPGIARDRFQVLEDGVEQKITYFWEDSRPITVGFLFDDSRRMDTDDKILVLKDAAQAFLKGKNPADEFFVARMASLANVVTPFSTQVSSLPLNYIASGEADGLALYDSIYMGLSVIKEAANPRKFLVVVTSGGDRCCSDNFKTTKEDVLKAYAMKQNVQIYPLFVVGQIEDADSEMVHRDGVVLSDLASMTGGRMWNAPNSARGVEALMAEIARGLKTQYLIGFKSTRPAHDGKRRGVKVKVSSPEGSQKLNVWTKAGYYAPKD